MKMKKIAKTTLIACAVFLSVLLILFIGMSWFVGTQVFAGSTQLVTPEETAGASDGFWESYGVDYDSFCATYKIERVELTSSLDGHIIPADHIFATEANGSRNNKTVVLVHGLGGNRLRNYPIAEMFLELGYNVITYDQRSSNENTARYTTFGYWEKYDLIDCISYAAEQAPGKALGVWGTSFGGATAGLAMENKDIESMIDFLILDCPVSSMEWMISEEMRYMDIGLPISYMTLCGNIINKIELGFNYEDADVCRAISNIEIPVLIINSKADTLTPQFMGQDIYDSIVSKECKFLWTVEDSEHTKMWLDHNREYHERVAELLELTEN